MCCSNLYETVYKILVIERDLSLLELLKEWLTVNEFCPLTAMTSEKAYQLLKVEQPDLILCSYKLVDASGLELLQKIRQDYNTARIPFLLMTGIPLDMIPNWQKHLKNDEIVFKPFAPNDLLKKLHSLLPPQV